MVRGKTWTEEEIELLENYWGSKSLAYICKKLNRNQNAVKLKAYRMGLGDPIKSFDGISINELANTIKISYKILVNWEDKYNLPVKYKQFSKEKRVRVISYQDWWEWAEQNKQMIDFTRFEKGELGPEPKWVEEKRKADHRKKLFVPRPHNTPWSSREINLLKFMVEKGTYTYPEICSELKRTHGAVKRKLIELGIKLRPQYLENHKPYKQSEIDYILKGIFKGVSIEEMARHLNRSEAGVRGKLERMGYKFKNGVPYKAS